MKMYEGNIHKALSSPMRRNIILFLGTGKKYLSEIAEHVGKTPQTVDFHLEILTRNGLVSYATEDGKKYYVLKDKRILKFLDERRPLPHKHHPKPPHEMILDVKNEMNERMDKIEKKLDEILNKLR